MANAIPVHSEPKPAKTDKKQESKPVEQPVVEEKKPRVYTLPSGSICQDN